MEEEAKNIARITVSDNLARINLGIVVFLCVLLALTTRYVVCDSSLWLC